MVRCACKWPVFQKYCGVCSLRTGICIKSIINLTILLLKMRASIIVLYIVISWMRDANNSYPSSITPGYNHSSDKNEIDTEDRLLLLTEVYRPLLTVCITQIILISLYMIVICCTVWAVCKQNAKMLKLFFYLNIPNWLFDLFVTILGGMQSNLIITMIMFLVRLFEPYNLLAIRSEYLRLTEKVPAAPNNGLETQHTYHTWFSNTPHDVEGHELHCRTCTCNLVPKLENITQPPQQPVTETAQTQEADDPPPTYENKELNFKEQPIIFDQNQVIEQGSSIIQHNGGDLQLPSQSIAPQTHLPLTANEVEKKIDLSEVPVIYDQSQLNIGSSSILENAKS